MQNRNALSKVLFFAMFVIRFFSILIIQVMSIVSLLLIAVLPGVLVYWFFPDVWEGYTRISNGELWGFLEGIGFVALVGALGLAPYLLFKSIEVVPRLISAIISEIKSISAGPWFPSLQLSNGQSSVFELGNQRARKVLSTTKSSIPLILAFTGIAVAVELAYIVANDERMTGLQQGDGTLASSVVDLRFNNGFGWTEDSVFVPLCREDIETNESEEQLLDDITETEGNTNGETSAQPTVEGALEQVVVVGRLRNLRVCFVP